MQLVCGNSCLTQENTRLSPLSTASHAHGMLQVLRAMEYGGVYVASAELDTPGL